MFGRSPDHVASLRHRHGDEARCAAKPARLSPTTCSRYYEHIRDNDIYVVYAVVPPQAARNPEFYQQQNIPVPTLRWCARTTTASSSPA